MPVSPEYVFKETASNLWRNRLMTIAAVLTVAVSLSLVGAALLLRQGAANAATFWEHGTEVQVFMKPTATKQEIGSVGRQLGTLSYIDQPCHYRTQKEAYEQALRLVGSVYKTSGVGVKGTPSSWVCTPTQLSAATAVAKKVRGQPGVKTVQVPSSQIHTQEKVINVLKWVFIAVAVVLLVSAAVLILNTIRMAIFARRREVSVMKLVGATNWFVRLPFMSEGLLQGLLGSGIAAGIVYLLHEVLDHFSTTPGSVISQMRMTGWEVFSTDVIVVLVGILIGTGGSALAIRRFLDV